MRQIKEVTIYEVAKKAQVSTATVSRAFVKNSPVSKKTRRKVLQAVENYYAQHISGFGTMRTLPVLREILS